MKTGEIPSYNFYDEDDPGSGFPKIPKDVTGFDIIQVLLSRAIFGEKNDKLIENINRIIKNLENMRIVLEENAFPAFIIKMIYWPIYIIIMVLNCMKDNFMWMLMASVVFGVFMAFFGAICVLVYIFYRGIRTYTEKYGWSMGGEEPEKEGERSDSFFSGFAQGFA